MELQVYECKNCGAGLDITKSENGIVQCKSCKSVFTIPKKEVSPAALSFLRLGEHDLDTGKFDDAFTAFKKAAEYDKDEPEAYWGMALAEFKVRYIKDIVNNRLQPICYEFTDKEFVKNKNYLAAVNCATEKQRNIYESKAQEIDYIRSAFLQLKQSELDYDCFICVKVSRLDAEQTDSTKKNWTDDAYNADAIYDLLKRSGFNPFFSEREIRGRSGADYEAMILYALYTSETMIVVCSNEEYLRTPWVQNEYSRFKSLVNNKEKENDALTIVFNKNSIERLPGDNHGRIQGIDYSRREAALEIVKFVESHTPLARAKKEEEKRKRDAQAEEIKKQIEAQKQAQKSLEEQLKNLNTSAATIGAAPTVTSLLTRAKLELSENNFEKGKEYFDKVLDSDPNNASAWFGLMLVDYRCTSYEELLNKISATNNVKFPEYEYLFNLNENKNYKLARRWADEELAQKLDAIDKACADRIAKMVNCEKIDPAAKFFFETVTKTDALNARAWYDLMLIECGCASGNELLSKIENTDNIENFEYLFTLKESPNYVNAKKYAEKDLAKTLQTISEAVSSRINELLNNEPVNQNAELFYKMVAKYDNVNAKAKWVLFLIDYGVSDEKYFIARLNSQLYANIIENENFISALRYAEGELKNRIQKFKAEIESPVIWWNSFLREFDANDENFIVNSITDKMLIEISASSNLFLAEKFANISDEKLAKRILNFRNCLKSAPVYWKLFLNDYNASSAKQIYSMVTEENAQIILSNCNFTVAMNVATDDFKTKLENFKQEVLNIQQKLKKERQCRERNRRIKKVIKHISYFLPLIIELIVVMCIDELSFISLPFYQLMPLQSKISFFSILGLGLIFQIVSCFGKGHPQQAMFAQITSFVIFCVMQYAFGNCNLSVITVWGLALINPVALFLSCLLGYLDLNDEKLILIYLPVALITLGLNCYHIGFFYLASEEPVIWLDITHIIICLIIGAVALATSVVVDFMPTRWIICLVGFVFIVLMTLIWSFPQVFIGIGIAIAVIFVLVIIGVIIYFVKFA